MPGVRRIDHVAVVVEDIDEALRFWRESLGLELTHVEDIIDQQSVVAFLPAGDSEIELVKPTSEDSGIARFLRNRGPGVHHLSFEVDDLQGYLSALKRRGVRLINPEPVIGSGGRRIAFIHPESAHGVLVELYEHTPEKPEVRLKRARPLASRVLAQGQTIAAGALAFLRALRGAGEKPD